mgnify:CR=1 FL=1
MGKILFWAVVIIGVLFVTRLLANQAANRRPKQDPQTTSRPKSTETLGKPEEMVRCGKCGVYMPRSDAIKQDEQFWCSTEHAKADQTTRS